MTKRVYNRESTAQVLQRTTWMTAGWIGVAHSAIAQTQSRRSYALLHTDFHRVANANVDIHLKAAMNHIHAAQLLMRLENINVQKEKK